jgi:hypothetical protein
MRYSQRVGYHEEPLASSQSTTKEDWVLTKNPHEKNGNTSVLGCSTQSGHSTGDTYPSRSKLQEYKRELMPEDASSALEMKWMTFTLKASQTHISNLLSPKT